MKLILIFTALLLTGQSFAQPLNVSTSFIPNANPHNIKIALKELFERNGTEILPGKRYLLKVAHNNGVGSQGYYVKSNKEIPSFLSGMIKSFKNLIVESFNTNTGLTPNEVAQMQDIMNSWDKTLGRYNDGPTPAPIPFKITLAISEKILIPMHKLAANPNWNRPWDVISYPAVSNPAVIAAWIDLIQEKGAEAWVGDESGTESPDTFRNMVATGVYDVVKNRKAHLWIFTQGEVDLPNSTKTTPVFIAHNREMLTAYNPLQSPHFAHYINNIILVPMAFTNDFFEGIFFEAHPKAHVLTSISANIKNFVGVMHPSSRLQMHNLTPDKSPWKIVGAHNSNSHLKIVETAYGLNRILKSKIKGYISDNIATITNMGPDVGPNLVFDRENWAITFSPNLYAQELVTCLLSHQSVAMIAERPESARGKGLNLNKYYKGKNPFGHEILEFYQEKMKQENARIKWNVYHAPSNHRLLERIRQNYNL